MKISLFIFAIIISSYLVNAQTFAPCLNPALQTQATCTDTNVCCVWCGMGPTVGSCILASFRVCPFGTIGPVGYGCPAANNYNVTTCLCNTNPATHFTPSAIIIGIAIALIFFAF